MTEANPARLLERLQAIVDSGANREEQLAPLVPDLISLFKSAAAKTRSNSEPNKDNWLWTGRRPDPDSETRGKIAQLLGKLGPQARVAVPALQEALNDFSVCRNYGYGKIAEQNHVCAYAAHALGKIGAAAVPALTSALGSEAICSRFFEPFAPVTGDITRLGELAAVQIEQIRRKAEE